MHVLTSPHRSPAATGPPGDEGLAALTLLADLRDWPADVEPDLIAAARDGRVTWEGPWRPCCGSVTAAPPSAATPA
ncbi:hypothetical protein AB0L65_56235 [Nonomuraea sp. NPDC052116]|uniref:hypothetical protein n=1 Tax=Nonomuraea sp. NPDC052116 TaxID=3155665 RepID=UPI00341290CC